YNGQNGWTGNPYVGAVSAVISASDIFASTTNMPSMKIQQIPSPSLQTASYYSLALTWTGMTNDPDDLIMGYTVYRSTLPAGTYTALTYTAAQNAGGQVSFTDAGLSAGTTYYYKIGVNYLWDGSGNTVNYYSSDALSNSMSAATKNVDTTDLKFSLQDS